MTRSVRARIAAVSLLLASTTLFVAPARADVFTYSGEIIFCLPTCDSFAALGASTGGSANTVNSVVSGTIDIPVQPDGSFTFGTPTPDPLPTVGELCNFVPSVPDIPFEFTIANSAADPCPPPDNPAQICTGTEANPLVLSPEVATVFGSGTVDAAGNFTSGQVVFTFQEPPFCNNNGQVTFDLVNSTAGGVILNAVTFTNIVPSGAVPGFAPAPPDLAVGLPVPDPFPPTVVGEIATADVTVTNSGLGVANITLDTAMLMAPFSIVNEDCQAGPIVGAGGTCTITVGFEPTAAGDNQTGSFVVTDLNNVPPSFTVTVVGAGIVPEIEVAPNPVQFPDVLVGQSSQLDVTVSNAGTAVLSIPLLGVSAATGDFAIATDGCSGLNVAPGGDCVIGVSFTPTLPGNRTGSFEITSNDLNEPLVTVALLGAGATPQISVSQNPLAFPSQLAGEVSVRTITATNIGSADLVIGMIDSNDLAAPLSLSSDACSTMTLAPNASCELMVQFAPATAGDFEDSFTIPSNDPDDAALVVTVTGTATAAPEPFITLAPAQALLLGDVIVSRMTMSTVTVANDGSADLVVGAIDIGGGAAAEYSQTNDCQTLAPTASCTITVTFSPAEVGVRNATLTVNSNAANDTMATIELSGNGVFGPQLTLSTAALSLGSGAEPVELDQSVTASLMLVSSGSQPVTVSGVALSGDVSQSFSISDDGCTSMTLDVMDTCDIEITFTPTSAGDKTATLTVASDDVDMPEQTAALTGFVLVGSRPEFSVPEIQIGASTAPVTVGESGSSEFDITNTGTDPLLVVSVALGGADAAEFSVTEDCTTQQVDRNAACSIDVTFAPSSPGQKTAELTIVTDSVVTRAQTRGSTQVTTVIPITAVAAEPPPPPPPPPGSQTNVPPEFATRDVGSGGACFIATAAYGSYLDPNVQVLRDFRDRVLMRSDFGRSIVRTYYANSPMFADHIARNDGARVVTRVVLTPIVYALAYPLPALLVLVSVWFGLRRRRSLLRARLEG